VHVDPISQIANICQIEYKNEGSTLPDQPRLVGGDDRINPTAAICFSRSSAPAAFDGRGLWLGVEGSLTLGSTHGYGR
jgi:hypothetical protein